MIEIQTYEIYQCQSFAGLREKEGGKICLVFDHLAVLAEKDEEIIYGEQVISDLSTLASVRMEQIAALEAEVAEKKHERDCLGKAIQDAAVKSEICRKAVSLTGPQLIMLCMDMAEEITDKEDAIHRIDEFGTELT